MTETNNNERDAAKLQDPEEEIKPRFTLEQIPELVNRLYGLHVKETKQLPGYDDLNFYVAVEDTWENENIKEINSPGYVVKILNSMQSAHPTIIEAQHAICSHVRERGVPTQVPILNKHGDEWTLQTTKQVHDGDLKEYGPYLVRLLTFIPGKIFYQTPYIPPSFYNVGKFMGRLHQAFKGFHHSFYDSYSLIWSLEKVPVLRDFLAAVKNEENVKVVNEVIDAFEKEVVPAFSKFSKGMIHGDINEQNAIMSEVPGQDDVPTGSRVHDVSAMLDFNDVTDSFTVFDVAICITYLSIDCPDEKQHEVGGHVLAGYFTSCSLNTDEFQALKVLVCSRLCQSLVFGAHAYAQQPENTYLLTTAERGWPLLYKLWTAETNVLYSRWREIINSYKSKGDGK